MPMSHSKARALYDSGAPVAQVAAALGMKATAFRAFRKKRGWPLRDSPIGKRAAVAPHDGGGASPAKAAALRRRIEAMTDENLASVQQSLSSGGATENIERNARLLASLVKTLAELRRLDALDPARGAADAVEGHDDQRPPRDLDTLRDELARALERLSANAGGPKAGG